FIKRIARLKDDLFKILNTKRISEVISVWGMHNAFGNYLEVRLVKWYNPDGVYFSIWSEA
ncbi:MAG: hypothetical protein ACYSOY_02545, partial [Planctomycetota bacterium]